MTFSLLQIGPSTVVVVLGVAREDYEHLGAGTVCLLTLAMHDTPASVI